ncbi:MAG TPA: Uma2 family endonuclease [Gammaproteobacteria bacterium]|nr:Uma2 family endonuclease [Gammaproteobacteria bacterium]
MVATADLLNRDDAPREDHFVHLRGATWADYERVLELRGDHSAPRITYLKGTLEIMSPSLPHEGIKSTIGRLVEVWCLARGIEFSTCGSWTLKDRLKECGAEPDECYVFGPSKGVARPELAIEVVWTSGGLDKLEIYRRLGVREVWYWRRGRISVHVLRGGERYEAAPVSEVLPGIDLEQLASFLDRPTTSAAIVEYRRAVEASPAR